ncbi:FAD binding domain-containing protein [Crepidotus variabilis]|uniref:FAD binding domain-containing protein n=1 Tax=Crepidotus variabilis TaxID=179855 RepID=A0A9P6EF90_9AGAR|nr:FAD binding domain-containing protein [Crepidotus variabilis]
MWSSVLDLPDPVMALFRYFSLALSMTSLSLSAATDSSRCRCLYGQDCWPNDVAFSTFSQKLSQPLIRPTPIAATCYSNSSSSSCLDATTNFHNSTWRTDQPGASQNINFETYIRRNGTVEGCYLNVTLGDPCKQGSVPPIGVDARNSQDVQAAVRFVKEHNLKLVVKNTGHDYLGRSSGRGSFMVWTHHLKNKSYNETFVPLGGPSNATFSAITIGAGTLWAEAYEFVNEQGRVLVGGIAVGGSVGAAGGWVMGGGHSVLSPKYGLGVDNVLEFQVVLADGSLVTANAYQHSDLFWALRGGGGGTYGIVTAATYKTHPSFGVGQASFQANFTSPEVAEKVMTATISATLNFTNAGWGGYLYIFPGFIAGIWVAPNASQAETETAFTPFASYLYNITGGQGGAVYNQTDSFYQWFYDMFVLGGDSQVGGNTYIASRLLSREIAEHNPAQAAKALLSIPGSIGLNVIGGGAVNRVDPSLTGLNPSWRHSLAEVYVTEGWEDGSNATVIQQAADRLKKNTDILENVSTDSGSYLNEGSLFERDFKKSYFGSHYSGLKAIKEKYDPTSVFIVASGVSSEEWNKDLDCLLD